MNDRFHRAAKDGYEGPLKQATKKDLNQPDSDGITPTLWAAYHGNLNALRLCCSRGGDPDKCDYTGNTALHYVCANGHLNCLMFLVSFGANIWQMDNDYHTVMDLAAIREQHNCVQFLDGVIAKQKSLDKKQVENLQSKAKKDAEKRIKKYEKMLQDQDKRMKNAESTSERARKTSSGKSDMNGGSNKFMTASKQTNKKTGIGSIISKKNSASSSFQPQNTFKISQDGGRTVKSLAGVQSGVHSGVMYMPVEGMAQSESQTVSNGSESKRKQLRNVFPAPHEQNYSNDSMSRSDTSSVFRTMAIRTNFKSANAMYSALGTDKQEDDEIQGVPSYARQGFNGSGAAGSLASFPSGASDSYNRWSDDNESLEEEEEETEIDTFLASLSLSEYSKLVKEQKVDSLELFMTFTLDDLKELGLPMGPRKKIEKALNERRSDFESPSEMELTEF